MGVQGFPTLKIVRPKKGGGKPIVQDYQGQRTASAIVDAVVQQINNYVVKVEDKSLDKFLDDKESPKAILFTEKGTTSALLKSVAIDFAGVITIGQARNKEAKTVETFGIEKFPTLILLPGGDAPTVVYDGELKKEAIVKFLSQAGQPNPVAPVKVNGKNKDKNNKASKASKAKASSSETSSAAPESETETATQEAPVIVETALPIPAIHSSEKLIKECLTEKSHTCVLAIVSSSEDEKAKKALSSLSELAFKHAQSKRNLFPFYEVPKSNEGAASLLKSLDLIGDVEIIAINARRGWWRHYDAADFGHESVESWIDAIRMSEGVKKKLPEGIVAIAVEEATSATPEASSEATPDATEAGASEEATPVTPEASGDAADDSTESTSTQAADPTGEPETAHDEL
jgi:protein disulfide-isomerase A6